MPQLWRWRCDPACNRRHGSSGRVPYLVELVNGIWTFIPAAGLAVLAGCVIAAFVMVWMDGP